MRKKNSQKGFTLIELMVTITIAAILLAIAVPSFRTISQNSQQSSAINQFASVIGRARSEAVSRNRQIVVCASANASSGNPQCSAPLANTWESGWIMFVDSNQDGQYQAGEVLLQVGQAQPTGVTVRGSGFGSSLIFAPATGILSNWGGFKYCDTRGFAQIRVLNVSRLGQIRVATDGDNDGNVEDAMGTNVTACTP